MMSSDSVTDAPVMSSLPIVEEGSESPEMSESVDRMLECHPPPHLMAEMGEAVDEVKKHMKTTADFLDLCKFGLDFRQLLDSCKPCKFWQ